MGRIRLSDRKESPRGERLTAAPGRRLTGLARLAPGARSTWWAWPRAQRVARLVRARTRLDGGEDLAAPAAWW